MKQPKQRPILFNEEMIRAIESGTKKQTRRTTGLGTFNDWNTNDWKFHSVAYHPDQGVHAFFTAVDGKNSVYSAKCIFGEIGDILYVRETWGLMKLREEGFEFPVYKAQVDSCGQVPSPDINNLLVTYKDSWKPSLHMPKKIARIWLEITNIRVERLHDIKSEDAISEGITKLDPWPEVPDKPRYKQYGPEYFNEVDSGLSAELAVFDPIYSFLSLWYSIYTDEAVQKNPWVWVIEFKQIENPNPVV